MSIEQKKVIDFMGIDTSTSEVKLVISDHLDWSDPKGDHLFLLQDKINDYLAYIESGEILEKYPEAKDKKIVIHVVGKYELNQLARDFYNKVNEMIIPTGVSLSFEYKKSKED